MESFLVAEGTCVTGKGDSAAIDLTSTAGRVFLLTLNITQVIEQESLDVAIQGSADGTIWLPKPLASFPQQFYRGQTPLLLDLTQQPEVRQVRAHWEVNRWGRGEPTPSFEFAIKIQDVPANILQEVSKKSA